MKYIYITLVVLLIGVITMAYLYFSNLNTETNANDFSLNLVSKDASIVFSFENDKSFYEILSGQELFQNILGESKSKLLKSLRENLIKDADIFKQMDGQKVYIGILPSFNNQVDFLITTQLKPNSDPILILNSLKNKNIKVNKIGNSYQLTFIDSAVCFVGVKNKSIVISNTQVTIENTLKNQKIDQKFAKYIKANSHYNKNTLANLYVDFSKIPPLLKNILNSNLNGELNVFNKQNTYAALSYNFGKDKLLFNGSVEINDQNNYFSLFTKLKVQDITIDNILPQKTANYTIYTIDDYNNWNKFLTAWLKKRNENEKISKNITNINQKYRLNLGEAFPKYFKNQMVTFQLSSGEKFGAIALSNGEKVNQLLLDLSTVYSPDIKIFKESNILYSFFGEPFKKFEKPFYTIIDNYLVMANNASSIQVFLNSYRNNELLINDEDYVGFSDQLSSTTTISFYVNNKNSNDIFGKNLKPQYFKQYQDKAGLKKYDGFCLQLSGDNGKFLSNLLINKVPEKIIETGN